MWKIWNDTLNYFIYIFLINYLFIYLFLIYSEIPWRWIFIEDGLGTTRISSHSISSYHVSSHNMLKWIILTQNLFYGCNLLDFFVFKKKLLHAFFEIFFFSIYCKLVMFFLTTLMAFLFIFTCIFIYLFI
jgi:hypothetical protein